jgi:hypothetical protein
MANVKRSYGFLKIDMLSIKFGNIYLSVVCQMSLEVGHVFVEWTHLKVATGS